MKREKKIRIAFDDIWDIIYKTRGLMTIVIYTPVDNLIPKIRIL